MSQSLQQIQTWCASMDRLLDQWNTWIEDFRDSSLTADSVRLESSVNLGQPIVNQLRSMLIERSQMLAVAGFPSLVHWLQAVHSDAPKSLIAKLRSFEDRAGRLRKSSQTQWVATSQTSRFLDEILFIVKSGNQAPATYSTNELEAFQGGFVLDSTA